MLVVSDATPLNILVRSELVHVLPALFETIVIPPAVHRELCHPSTPPVVREWAQRPHALRRLIDDFLPLLSLGSRDPRERQPSRINADEFQ